jgi:hypothetical protein
VESKSVLNRERLGVMSNRQTEVDRLHRGIPDCTGIWKANVQFEWLAEPHHDQKSVISNTSHDLCCHPSNGSTFGNGFGIHVASDYNANTTSYTYFGTDYINNTGIGGTQVFTGEQCCTMQEMYVLRLLTP